MTVRRVFEVNSDQTSDMKISIDFRNFNGSGNIPLAVLAAPKKVCYKRFVADDYRRSSKPTQVSMLVGGAVL
jgi:hypothetical protein